MSARGCMFLIWNDSGVPGQRRLTPPPAGRRRGAPEAGVVPVPEAAAALRLAEAGKVRQQRRVPVPVPGASAAVVPG